MFSSSSLLFLKRSFIILSIGLFFFYNSTALNYYWIGNGGNWSSISHWATTSGGTTLHTQLPTATDDVFFDVNSFSLPGQAVNLNQPNNIAHHINWSGVLNDPSWNGIFPNTLKIYGSLTLVPNMFMNFTGQIHFSSTTVGQTITTAGKSFSAFLFNGAGGEWTFLDSFNCTGLLNLFAGTLNTNDQVINASGVYSGLYFGSSLLRTLNCGASVFNLSGGQPWSGLASNLTLNCGSSIINCSSTNVQFSAIGTYNDVNFTNAAGTATINGGSFHDVDFAGKATINGPANFHNVTFHKDGTTGPYSQDIYRCTFNDLNFTEGHTYRLGVLTVNGNLHAVGSCLKLISIRPVGNSNTSYITFANPVHLSYVDLRSTLPIGAGPFIIDHSLPFCCNGGWTYQNTAANMYWIGNGGNWNDPNHWSYTSGGSPAGCFPFQDNNVFFDANSFSQPSQSVTIDSAAYCMDMDWTGITNSPTLELPAQKGIHIFGSLTLNPAMNVNQVDGLNPSWLYLDARTPGETVTTHGRQLGNIGFGGWGDGGEWTLQDSLTTNDRLYLFNGTLNTNNQVINAETVSLWGGTLNMTASVFNVSGKYAAWSIWTSPAIHINCGTSVINMTYDTAFVSNSSLSASTAYTLYDVNFLGTKQGGIGGYALSCHNVVFNGDGFISQSYTSNPCTYNDVTFHKDGYIGTINTFHDINFTKGYTYQFESGRTQTITNRWNIAGTCTGNITIQSTTPGTFASINKATGLVNGNYLKIKDVHATGSATFNAYNSIDQGGNTGWNFTSPPALGNPGPVSGSSTVCVGASGIIFHLSPVPGAFSYLWTVPPGAIILSGQGDTLIVVDFGNSSSGNIQVQSFDGCNLSSSTSSLPITVLPRLTPTVSLSATPGTFVCPATVVSFIASVAGTGNSLVNYEFKINGAIVQSSNLPVFTSAITDGDVVNCVISVSGSSCYTATTAISNDIIMHTSPNAQPVNVNAGSNVSISLGQTVQLSASSDNGTYLWSPATGLSSVNILNPLASPTATTQYTLTITTTAGCSASDDILVEVKGPVPDCNIKPLNAFTPNGDGINDKWIVFSGNCIKYPAVIVYNRYGNPVYQSQHYQNDWEGTYKGKQLPDGTYYAVITYTVNGSTIVKKTDISILR
jgi:gliding motility-associated-like protein